MAATCMARFVGQGLELVGAGDEIGFAVDLHHARPRLPPEWM